MFLLLAQTFVQIVEVTPYLYFLLFIKIRLNSRCVNGKVQRNKLGLKSNLKNEHYTELESSWRNCDGDCQAVADLNSWFDSNMW